SPTSADIGMVGGHEVVGGGDGSVRRSGAVDRGGVGGEQVVRGDGAVQVPGVSGVLSLSRLDVGLVVEGQVVGEGAAGSVQFEAIDGVVVGGAGVDAHCTVVSVVGVPIGCVVPSRCVVEFVGHVWGRVSPTEFESVAVTREIGQVPPIETIAVDKGVDDGDGVLELPGVETVVGVVPEPCASNDVPGTRALLDRQAVGALPVLAGVPVSVAVQVEDEVVGGLPLQLETAFIVFPRHQVGEHIVITAVAVVAVGTVDQLQTDHDPVGCFLVNGAAFVPRDVATDRRGTGGQVLSVDDHAFALVGGEGDGLVGRSTGVDRDVLVVENVGA